MRHVRATTVTVEKTISLTYSECTFVALVIEHAMPVHLQNILPNYLIKVRFKKELLNVKCEF
jgi:hypothetical protein